MSKIAFSIKTEVKTVPVQYMQMLKLKRSGKAFGSKKDYNRKDKHRKDWMEV